MSYVLASVSPPDHHYSTKGWNIEKVKELEFILKDLGLFVILRKYVNFIFSVENWCYSELLSEYLL